MVLSLKLVQSDGQRMKSANGTCIRFEFHPPCCSLSVDAEATGLPRDEPGLGTKNGATLGAPTLPVL